MLMGMLFYAASDAITSGEPHVSQFRLKLHVMEISKPTSLAKEAKRHTSWGMIDTSLHSKAWALIDTSLHSATAGDLNTSLHAAAGEYSSRSRARLASEAEVSCSSLKSRKSQLAANYGAWGEQRNALKQKRSSWASMDIFDILDMEDYSDDDDDEEEDKEVRSLADEESEENDPTPQDRRDGMGEKKVYDMLIDEVAIRRTGTATLSAAKDNTAKERNAKQQWSRSPTTTGGKIVGDSFMGRIDLFKISPEKSHAAAFVQRRTISGRSISPKKGLGGLKLDRSLTNSQPVFKPQIQLEQRRHQMLP